jgi:hypothetical protein
MVKPAGGFEFAVQRPEAVRSPREDADLPWKYKRLI